MDDFQYAAGQSAGNGALAVMPNGKLLAAGYGYDAAGNGHALVISSTDGGVTWSAPLDDFTGPILGDNPWYTSVGSDPAGNLYAAGAYNQCDDPDCNTITEHWFVRRSADAGATWSIVDDVAFSNFWGFGRQANAIAADAAGNVYVAGFLDTTPSAGTWTVRKSVGGASFTTVDTLPTAGIIGATAIFVHPTAGIFVAGQADVVVSGRTIRAWIVRRSTNAGATWQTVDTFYGTKGATYYFGQAHGIGADSHGNLYVAGALAIPYKGSSVWEWVVRKSTNGGGSWSTADQFQLSASGPSIASGFAADSAGNLFVCGYASATGDPYFGRGTFQWIVRENPGGTGSWSTVDNFQYAPGGGASAAAITANAAGNLFVGGSGGGHWLVRKR